MISQLFLLFTAAFVSASLLPGGSEAVFLALLVKTPAAGIWLLLTASAGNTLGALTSYFLGRYLPDKASECVPALLRRYGIWALLLSWLPVIGDALPLAAGWLRYRLQPCIILIEIGKTARYAFLWWAAGAAGFS